MICNKSIVCMPMTIWESSFTNTLVKMMTLLSKKNKILFVDYEYTYKDILASFAGKRNTPVKRMLGINERLRKIETEIGTHVYVLTPPPVFPVNWIKNEESYRFFLKLNATIIKGSIRKALQELQMEEPIVVNGYNPFFGLPLAGAFNESLNLYYCYDEINGDQWYNFHGPRIEQEYMRKADAVITTSDMLYNSKCGFNPNCYVVKNGVDFGLFNSIASYIKPAGSKKIVGYTGSIEERFDTETMCYVIENLPEVDFEFVGRVTNENAKNRLRSFPNVKLSGSKKPSEVPEFLKKMDVTLIPYLKNEVTKGVYPLKINEYLAAGKPVVMMDFAPLPEFDKIVKVASNKEEFLKYVIEEMLNDSFEKQRLRIETARQNSWENRVAEFSDIIEDILPLKLKKSA
jgi:glycosyltransferase involved in cell wall biosynthesis